MPGPLRTFFRQNAGFPQDEDPELGAFNQALAELSNSRAATSGYPPMPGPPPRPRAMPAMPRQGWADVIAQALSGAGDVISAGGGRPTNYLQQTMGVQQGLRNQAYQQALAQHSALEQAARLANEYEWRKYGAGQAEKRQSFSEKMKQREMDLYDQMLGKEKDKRDRETNLFTTVTVPETVKGAEDPEELQALKLKLLMETKGDPVLMKRVEEGVTPKLNQVIQKNAVQQMPGPFLNSLQALSDANAGLWASRIPTKEAQDFEKLVQAEYQKLMSEAPPISDPYGWGHVGRAQQFRALAEANVKQRLGIK